MSICEILTQIGSKLAQIPVPDFKVEIEVEMSKLVDDLWRRRLTHIKSNQRITYRDRETENKNKRRKDVDDEKEIRLAKEITMNFINRELEENKMAFVADYADEIFSYFELLESQMSVSDDFMKGKHAWAFSRARLIDYILLVHHKSRFIAEILYKCVQLIDFFIQASKKENLSFDRFSLVCAACFFLAIKCESRTTPLKCEFILSIASCTNYTLSDLRRCEIEILKKIEFKVNKPLPIDFLRCFCQYIDATHKEYTMAKFFMEITLHDHRFSSMNPSILAACALTLAFRFYKRPQLQEMMHEIYMSFDYEAIRSGTKKIAMLVLTCLRPDHKFKAVFFKYADKSLLNANLSKSQIFEKFIIQQVY